MFNHRWSVLVLLVLLGLSLACASRPGAAGVPAITTTAIPNSPTATSFVPQGSLFTATPTFSASPTPSAELPTTSPVIPSPVLTVTPIDVTVPLVTATQTPVTVTPQAYLPTVTRNWALSVWETQITLNTYAWEQALIPTEPGDPIYPYPRLDHGAVGGPQPRSYQAVVLENAYARVIVLPELGGRVWSWEDRQTGRRLTYANPVIKPTGWGYRGWWLGTGGLEWAFPVDEHGLNEWRLWQYQLLSGSDWRGVRVWDVDDRTGLSVEVTLKLYAGRSEFFIAPRIANPTATSQPFQFWINGMLTLSDGNAPSQNLRFWMPTEQVIVHSTSDGALPGPASQMNWPIYNGRDFSRYSEWRAYLGVFATQAHGVVAAYDEGAEQGVVRVYPGHIATGVKLFCLGELPASLYTDDGSRYFELWGGYTRTFWGYAQLAPGGVVAWEERWYPVNHLPGVTWANADMAVSLRMVDGGVQVGLYAPHRAMVQLVLRQNGAPVAEWAVSAGPETPFRVIHAGGGDGWDLQIWQEGVLLAQLGPA